MVSKTSGANALIYLVWGSNRSQVNIECGASRTRSRNRKYMSVWASRLKGTPCSRALRCCRSFKAAWSAAGVLYWALTPAGCLVVSAEHLYVEERCREPPTVPPACVQFLQRWLVRSGPDPHLHQTRREGFDPKWLPERDRPRFDQSRERWRSEERRSAGSSNVDLPSRQDAISGVRSTSLTPWKYLKPDHLVQKSTMTGQ